MYCAIASICASVNPLTDGAIRPSSLVRTPLHLAGARVQAGDLAGYLHFIEEWARPPVPVEFRGDGTIWMAPGSGRVRKGDVVGVVMQPYSGG